MLHVINELLFKDNIIMAMLSSVGVIIAVVGPAVKFIKGYLDKTITTSTRKPVEKLFLDTIYQIPYIGTFGFLLLTVYLSNVVLFRWIDFEKNYITYFWVTFAFFILVVIYYMLATIFIKIVFMNVRYMKIIGALSNSLFFGSVISIGYKAFVISLNGSVYSLDEYLPALVFGCVVCILLSLIYNSMVSDFLKSLFYKLVYVEYNIYIKNKYYRVDDLYINGNQIIGVKKTADGDVFFAVEKKLENIRLRLSGDSVFYPIENEKSGLEIKQ